MRHTRYKREKTQELTRREAQILELVEKGLQSKDIGLELGVTEKTVKFHLTNIYRKLGICGRKDLGVSTRSEGYSFKKEEAVFLENTDHVLPLGANHGLR